MKCAKIYLLHGCQEDVPSSQVPVDEPLVFQVVHPGRDLESVVSQGGDQKLSWILPKPIYQGSMWSQLCYLNNGRTLKHLDTML